MTRQLYMEISVFLRAVNSDLIIQSFPNLLKWNLMPRQSGHIAKFWECFQFKWVSTINPKLALNRDVTYGKLVLNFMSIEGGSRLDIRGYFFACLLLGTQIMGKHQGRQGM